MGNSCGTAQQLWKNTESDCGGNTGSHFRVTWVATAGSSIHPSVRLEMQGGEDRDCQGLGPLGVPR